MKKERPVVLPGLKIVFLVFCITGLFSSALWAAQQYKKAGVKNMADIVSGNSKKVVAKLTAFLAEHPDDLEARYCLAVAYAQTGALEKSVVQVKDAVIRGLPFERFLAGPRDLLAPLYRTKAFQALARAHPVALVHGPMLGCVTSHGASIWVRTGHAAQVRVILSRQGEVVSQSPVVSTDLRGDFTAVLPATGLRPSTEYDYQVSVNGTLVSPKGTFMTYPKEGEGMALRIGFGGGAGFTPKYERIWETIRSRGLQAFLFLGDNVYIDRPEMPAVQRYCYYRRQSRPEFRGLVSGLSVYAIWDDHDFTTNDAWGGPEIKRPSWKIPVWRIFRENWNNPSYAGGEAQPGCWFDFMIGNVHFIMLDGRYYRTSPKVDKPSILGPVQKEWLFRRLKASTGVFKILASPVPWALGVKPGSKDPWQGYPEEREAIFSFIEKQKVEGVVLLSADRHRSDVWKIQRNIGYDLFEFESSKLSNIHTHGKIKGALFSYNEKCSFGMLSFNTKFDDPEVKYSIINIDNEVVHEHVLKRSQLTFGTE